MYNLLQNIEIDNAINIKKSKISVTEPNIIINGTILSQGASLTIRVAIEHFALLLSRENCLGNDKIGRNIREGYIEQIDNIRRIIY